MFDLEYFGHEYLCPDSDNKIQHYYAKLLESFGACEPSKACCKPFRLARWDGYVLAGWLSRSLIFGHKFKDTYGYVLCLMIF